MEKKLKYHTYKELNFTNPLEELDKIIAFDSKDYSACYRDAMMYGIVCGWDDDSYEELSQKFGWTAETVERLKKLHDEYEKLWIIAQG